jgi:hypothetical protein
MWRRGAPQRRGARGARFERRSIYWLLCEVPVPYHTHSTAEVEDVELAGSHLMYSHAGSTHKRLNAIHVRAPNRNTILAIGEVEWFSMESGPSCPFQLKAMQRVYMHLHPICTMFARVEEDGIHTGRLRLESCSEDQTTRKID